MISILPVSDIYSKELLQFSKSIAHDNVILSTSVKQDQKSLDQLIESYNSFKKIPIITYKDETYYFNYWQIFDAIKELLRNNEIFEHCIFKFALLNYEEQKIYSKQYNRNW